MNRKTVLLLIDLQLCAFDGKITPAVAEGEKLLEKIKGILSIAREKEVPIVYVQTRATSGNPYAEDMHGWEIHPAVSPKSNDTTVYKRESSGFVGTSLQSELAGLGAESIIVSGIWSEYCVANTCLDALKLGLEVVLVSDAHSTCAESDEQARSVGETQNDLLQSKGVNLLHTSEFEAFLAGP